MLPSSTFVDPFSTVSSRPRLGLALFAVRGLALAALIRPFVRVVEVADDVADHVLVSAGVDGSAIVSFEAVDETVGRVVTRDGLDGPALFVGVPWIAHAANERGPPRARKGVHG